MGEEGRFTPIRDTRGWLVRSGLTVSQPACYAFIALVCNNVYSYYWAGVPPPTVLRSFFLLPDARGGFSGAAKGRWAGGPEPASEPTSTKKEGPDRLGVIRPLLLRAPAARSA